MGEIGEIKEIRCQDFKFWLNQQNLQSNPDLNSACISVHIVAVADAVRTSLGPRGMDKMVRKFTRVVP